MNTVPPTTFNDTLLALDTSGPRLQLALLADGEVVSHCEDIAKGHAEILFDRVQKLLQANQKTYQDLGKIAVTTGPGSFTGLRIGIAAARGVGLALKRPVIGVPNLLALSLNRQGQDFFVVVDARRNQYYAQGFAAPGNPNAPPHLLEKEQLQGKLQGKLQRKLQHETVLSDPRIDIEKMAVFAAGVEGQDFPPLPTYVRAADAKPQTKLRIERA